METYEEVVSGSNGYTCSRCGMWVWNNTYHYCGGNYYPRYGYYWTDCSQEIIDLLKEIKELLQDNKIIEESK
uniref:Uncharacterized protein n=1 Tax=viral metagenome TaxID=1070528 RepID=A0A6M3J7Z4_9ZZZZ